MHLFKINSPCRGAAAGSQLARAPVRSGRCGERACWPSQPHTGRGGAKVETTTRGEVPKPLGHQKPQRGGSASPQPPQSAALRVRPGPNKHAAADGKFPHGFCDREPQLPMCNIPVRLQSSSAGAPRYVVLYRAPPAYHVVSLSPLRAARSLGVYLRKHADSHVNVTIDNLHRRYFLLPYSG